MSGRPLSRTAWKRAVQDSLLGNRGLTKAVLLLLPWAVLVAPEHGFAAPGAASGFFLMLAAISGWLMTCILANDLADRREDAAAGKVRWVSLLPGPARVAAFGFAFALGPAVLILSAAPTRAGWAYAAATALGLSYSVRPFRLKTRGRLGIAAYALACTAAYVLLPWAWLRAGWAAAALGVAVFLDKWVNLSFHQVVDLAADEDQGVRTHAVRAGAPAARRSLDGWARGAVVGFVPALWAALDGQAPGMKIAILAVTGVVVLGGSLVLSRQGQQARPGGSLVRELPAVYLASAYGLFRVLPLVLILRFALDAPALRPVMAAALGLVALDSLMLLRYPS
jgi:4-hydroxybenzoate polyprenyltransferase